VRVLAADVRATSTITGERVELAFAGLHQGDRRLTGGVEPHPGAVPWHAFPDALGRPCVAGDVALVERSIAEHVRGGTRLSVTSLLGAGRVRAVEQLLAGALDGLHAMQAARFEEAAPLLRWLVAQRLPVPPELTALAATVLR